MLTTFGRLASKWAVQEELAPTTGTPHLQGSVWLKRKKRFTQLGFPAIHSEAIKNWEQSVTYCTREDKRKPNGRVWCAGVVRKQEVHSLLYEDYYDWQRAICDKIRKDPDDRTIYWIHEATGGVGKSALTRSLCHREDCMLTGGKAADMKYQIACRWEKHGTVPKAIIFDIPRSSMQYLSYAGMEEIKNGCFASNKYESAMCIVPFSHVICFSNELPDFTAVSKDRWKVGEIVTTGDIVSLVWAH